jgi:hypothetical protein
MEQVMESYDNNNTNFVSDTYHAGALQDMSVELLL